MKILPELPMWIQVPVPFIFDTGFRVGGLLFALGTVLVTKLVNQILGKFATFDIDLYLPAFIAPEYLVDELAPCSLRRLLA